MSVMSGRERWKAGERTWPQAASLRFGEDLRLCKTPAFCYSRSPFAAAFPGSSVVEQPAVNRLVAGSNPARGASFFIGLATASSLLKAEIRAPGNIWGNMLSSGFDGNLLQWLKRWEIRLCQP